MHRDTSEAASRNTPGSVEYQKQSKDLVVDVQWYKPLEKNHWKPFY